MSFYIIVSFDAFLSSSENIKYIQRYNIVIVLNRISYALLLFIVPISPS